MFSHKPQKLKNQQNQTMQNKIIIPRCWTVIFTHLWRFLSNLLTVIFAWLPPKMIEISTFKIEFSAICFSTEHEDSVWSGSSGNNLTLCPWDFDSLVNLWSVSHQLPGLCTSCWFKIDWSGSRVRMLYNSGRQSHGAHCFVEHVRGWHAQGTFI